MLSRSGLSIRKLIPHRRLNDDDLTGAELKKEYTPRTSWTEQEPDGEDGGSGSGNSYTTKRYSSRKKRSPAPIIATSPLTHSDILRPLPPLPSETPRSSASSSSRCELHTECDCPLLSRKRRSPLYLISSKDDCEDPTLLSCVNSYNPDGTLTSHIPKSRFYFSGSPEVKEDGAKNIEHKEDGSKKYQSEDPSRQEVSHDVQQFIQETEDAFKAIGSTLSADVNSHQTTLPEITKADSSDIPRDLEPGPPTPPPKEPRLSLSKSPSARAPIVLSASPPSSPPKQNTSMQAPKRKKSKKSKQARSMRSTRRTAALKQAVRSGPRWTLSENVSELLTGKLFHRIEADEMLTPDQIEAFKQQRITKLQVEKMAEALEQELADASIEAFLDDLSLRTESAGTRTDVLEEKPAISFSEDVVQRDFLFEREHKRNFHSPPLADRSSFHKNKSSPTMSTRHVRSSSRKLMTELPIIPETSTAPRASNELYFGSESDVSLSNSSTSEYVYLRSSPYSVATPNFQHGHIRLSKSDLAPEMRFGGDEGLDWTAFQMAILGGAGDFLSGGDDTLRPWEDEDTADIAEWWDSWHFESTGGLVTHNYEAPSPTSTLSGDEIPELSHSEIDSDNANSPNHKWQAARRKTRATGLQLDFDHTKRKTQPLSQYFTDGQATTNDTWRRDSEEKQVVVDRQSLNSLPPSPMLDLRIIRTGNGDDLDVVPMGYNLGHDLGDFLKWEAQHAYAGDFNSPSGLM
ncbi:hypothetical protein F4802DRAFT_606609 [Xylaria palmicola]|nr:hypothetical protein F4802DRAFT_606609 [Xylaria palmicola]